MTGVGLTVTVTVNAAPVQLPAVGVTLYVAVTALAVLLTRLSFRLLWPDCAPVLPERPAPSVGALQSYVVPDGINPAGV